MIAGGNSRQIKVKPEIRPDPEGWDAWQVAFFDVGDTLAAPHPSFSEIISAVCRRHGFDVSPDQVAAASPDLNLAFSGAISGQPPYRTTAGESERFWEWVYERTLEGLQIHAPGLPRAICREFERPENYRLYPDALEALALLRSEGIRLGIISNWEVWLPSLLERLGIAEYFEAVVISGAVGLHKPEPAIFQHAVEIVGVTPANAVHIGDSLRSDYHGALGAGLGAVLVDRANRYAGHDLVRVRSLVELPALLTPRR